MIRGWLALCLLAAAAPPGTLPAGKKVYISVDMEGISGISGGDQLAAGQSDRLLRVLYRFINPD